MKDKFQEKPLIGITDELWAVLDKIKDSPLTWSIADLEKNPLVHNPMRVQEIDLGDKEYRINLKIANKYQPVKLSAFIRNFFGEGQFYQEEIDDFIFEKLCFYMKDFEVKKSWHIRNLISYVRDRKLRNLI